MEKEPWEVATLQRLGRESRSAAISFLEGFLFKISAIRRSSAVKEAPSYAELTGPPVSGVACCPCPNVGGFAATPRRISNDKTLQRMRTWANLRQELLSPGSLKKTSWRRRASPAQSARSGSL